jgi:hypothetical protein
MSQYFIDKLHAQVDGSTVLVTLRDLMAVVPEAVQDMQKEIESQAATLKLQRDSIIADTQAGQQLAQAVDELTAAQEAKDKLPAGPTDTGTLFADEADMTKLAFQQWAKEQGSKFLDDKIKSLTAKIKQLRQAAEASAHDEIEVWRKAKQEELIALAKDKLADLAADVAKGVLAFTVVDNLIAALTQHQFTTHLTYAEKSDGETVGPNKAPRTLGDSPLTEDEQFMRAVNPQNEPVRIRQGGYTK